MKIILATTSPYRREVFGYLGIPFEGEGSNVDESQLERDDPEKLVKGLSRLKAEAVAKFHPDSVVIGMDSVAYFKGKILEKPKSKQEAFERLKGFSNNSYQFYTGVFMVNTSNKKELQRVVKSDVFFRELSDSEIERYLEQDPDYKNYAHGYDPVKNISSSFVAKIVGSPHNVFEGMPLETVVEMLREIGYKE